MQAGGDDGAAGTAGLYQLERGAVLHPLAVNADYLAQGDAHRHFDQTGEVGVAQDGVDLCARTAGGAKLAEPGGAVAQDGRHIGQGLDVVHQGWFAHQPVGRRVGRAGAGFAAFTLQGFDQGGLLPADVRPRPRVNVDVEIETAAEDILAQQPVLAGLFDRPLQAVVSQVVFAADVDETFARPNGIGGDRHRLDDAVGVAFQDQPVFEGARFALVGVADHVLGLSGGGGNERPLASGGEAGPAAPLEPGSVDLGDHFRRGHLGHRFGQGFVAAVDDVILDALRVDAPGPLQHNALLGGERALAGAQPGDLPGQLSHGGEQAFHHPALVQVFLHQVVGVFGTHRPVDHRLGVDHHHRDGVVPPEVAHRGQSDLIGQTKGLDLFLKRLREFLRPELDAQGVGRYQNHRSDRFHLAFLLSSGAYS